MYEAKKNVRKKSLRAAAADAAAVWRNVETRVTIACNWNEKWQTLSVCLEKYKKIDFTIKASMDFLKRPTNQ